MDESLVDEKRKMLEQKFYAKHKMKRDALASKLDSQIKQKGSHDPNNPFVFNQLNISVMNPAMNMDRRIEMGIIAQRQRRRFNQLRRLGIRIPSPYKRVHSVRTYPKLVQDELVRYPETILEDSDYESDATCLKKYSTDPLPYLTKNDQQKRNAIEMNSDPVRIWNARRKKGQHNYQSLG